jgi:hypothetical protein
LLFDDFVLDFDLVFELVIGGVVVVTTLFGWFAVGFLFDGCIWFGSGIFRLSVFFFLGG